MIIEVEPALYQNAMNNVLYVWNKKPDYLWIILNYSWIIMPNMFQSIKYIKYTKYAYI